MAREERTHSGCQHHILEDLGLLNLHQLSRSSILSWPVNSLLTSPLLSLDGISVNFWINKGLIVFQPVVTSLVSIVTGWSINPLSGVGLAMKMMTGKGKGKLQLTM